MADKKPDPQSVAEQAKGGPIDQMNARYAKRMAEGQGKGKDPFDPSHPAQQRSDEFRKRYGFLGERTPEQLKSMTEEEKASATKKAQEASEKEIEKATSLDSYKQGGRVKKTGPAYLHKGEKVLSTRQTKKLGVRRKRHSARKRG